MHSQTRDLGSRYPTPGPRTLPVSGFAGHLQKSPWGVDFTSVTTKDTTVTPGRGCPTVDPHYPSLTVPNRDRVGEVTVSLSYPPREYLLRPAPGPGHVEEGARLPRTP